MQKHGRFLRTEGKVVKFGALGERAPRDSRRAVKIGWGWIGGAGKRQRTAPYYYMGAGSRPPGRVLGKNCRAEIAWRQKLPSMASASCLGTSLRYAPRAWHGICFDSGQFFGMAGQGRSASRTLIGPASLMKWRSNMATKFVPSDKANLALAQIDELCGELKDWGANEHLLFLRLLALQFAQEKSEVKEVDGKPTLFIGGKRADDKDCVVTVRWPEWRKEMTVGKYAECANLKKGLYESGDYPQFAPTKKADAGGYNA